MGIHSQRSVTVDFSGSLAVVAWRLGERQMEVYRTILPWDGFVSRPSSASAAGGTDGLKSRPTADTAADSRGTQTLLANRFSGTFPSAARLNVSGRFVAGEEPTDIHVSAHMHERGVDDLIVATLKFPSGVVASFTAGMSVHADNTAYICGTEGFIEIPIPWKPPVACTGS